MAPLDLTDAFNDCVDRLHAGHSIDDCLRSYPQHAARLRPLLETAEVVRRANPVVPAAVRARVRARVMQSGAYTPRHVWPWSARVMLAAASFAVVVAVAVVLAVLNRQPDRRLHIVPLSTGSPTNTPTLTASPSTPTLTPTPQPTVTATAAPSQTPRGPTASIAPSATPTATASITPAAALPILGVSPAAGLEASPSAEATVPASPSPEADGGPEQAAACQFTVSASSANLRSGPGTGYTAVGYGYAGDKFPVTAQHPSGEWFQVQTDSGEAWIAASVGQLSGDCTSLPVSDAPLMNGVTPVPETGDGISPTPGEDGSSGGGVVAPTPDDNHGGSDDSGHDNGG
jgi:hypothetical protein